MRLSALIIGAVGLLLTAWFIGVMGYRGKALVYGNFLLIALAVWLCMHFLF
jgi:hypothetical protein